MRAVSKKFFAPFLTCVTLSCSHPAVAPENKTGENTPSQVALPEAPTYADVPHPGGTDLADVRALFRAKGAPALNDLKDCDSGYLKLKAVTASLYELQEGVREFVRQDPVHYHWCFYGKVLALEETLSGDTYIDERQKATIETYSFLAPVARAFMSDFYDSRYLRWAMRRYENISERIFYRRLQTTPDSTSEIVEATNPFGLWKDTTRGPAFPDNVLEKYGLATPPAEAVSPAKPAALAEAVPVTAPVVPLPPAAPAAVAVPAVEAVPNIVAAPATVSAPVTVAAPVAAAPPDAAANPPTAAISAIVAVPAPAAAPTTALAATNPPPAQTISVDGKSAPSDSMSDAASKAAAVGAATQSAIYGSAATVGGAVSQTPSPPALQPASETASDTAGRLPAQETPSAAAIAAPPGGVENKPLPAAAH